jgi:dephospho-CoA kinase
MSKTEKIILIDGIRSYEEVELFKKEFGDDFILIAIVAPLKIRFERLRKRGKEWDMKTIEELKWRDKVELGWGTKKSISLSDFVIDNTGTLEDLHKKIDEVLSKITGQDNLGLHSLK